MLNVENNDAASINMVIAEEQLAAPAARVRLASTNDAAYGRGRCRHTLLKRRNWLAPIRQGEGARRMLLRRRRHEGVTIRLLTPCTRRSLPSRHWSRQQARSAEPMKRNIEYAANIPDATPPTPVLTGYATPIVMSQMKKEQANSYRQRMSGSPCHTRRPSTGVYVSMMTHASANGETSLRWKNDGEYVLENECRGEWTVRRVARCERLSSWF